MPEPIIATILAAVVAGATAKAGEVASQVVADAYAGLKSLIIQKLGGKMGAVQSVEDDPEAEEAQANLAKALANKGLQEDADLIELAARVERAIEDAKAAGVQGVGDIDVKEIRGKANATVERLAATGNIRLGPVIAETGDARVSDLSAGRAAASTAEDLKKKP